MKILWRRAWQLTLVFLPGDSHGQRSLACYSSQGLKESDVTEVTEHAHVVNLSHLCMYSPAAAKSLQSCPTLCDPMDGSPPGSPVPGILQARTLEWVDISFSNAWKWKVKVKSLSRVRLLATPWTAAHQAPPSMGFSRQECWSGVPAHCHPNPVQRFAAIGKWHMLHWASLVIQMVICLQCRRPRFDPWVGKIPWRREWQPTPVFLPGESHDRRARWATVHGVAERWRRQLISKWTFSFL